MHTCISRLRMHTTTTVSRTLALSFILTRSSTFTSVPCPCSERVRAVLDDEAKDRVVEAVGVRSHCARFGYNHTLL